MPFITLGFPTLNVSVQPTDIVYACLTTGGQAGTNNPNTTLNTTPYPVGIITNVNHAASTITFDDTLYTPYPALTILHYYFFGKDKSVNISGILGYYALVEYRNYSLKQVEMFATGTEFAPSSK